MQTICHLELDWKFAGCPVKQYLSSTCEALQATLCSLKFPICRWAKKTRPQKTANLQESAAAQLKGAAPGWAAAPAHTCSCGHLPLVPGEEGQWGAACFPLAQLSWAVYFEGICETKKIWAVIFDTPLELRKGTLVCLALMNCMNSCLLNKSLYALFYS